MTSRHLLLTALLCLATATHAQSTAESKAPARFQLYGGYSFLSNSFNGLPGFRQPLNGWDSSIAFGAWHNLRFKIDVSGVPGDEPGRFAKVGIHHGRRTILPPLRQRVRVCRGARR